VPLLGAERTIAMDGRVVWAYGRCGGRYDRPPHRRRFRGSRAWA